MCRTPYCFGDCDECIEDERRNQEYEDANSECPYRKECNIETVNVKLDICTECGRNFNY